MDEKTINVNIRHKDYKILCPCGSKTYVIGHLINRNVIEVCIYCMKDSQLVKKYNRLILKREDD